MAIETASFINQLTSTNPVVGDPLSEGDDHLRMIKACIRATWPNMTAIACTPTTAEFNQLVGVNNPIQTQLNARALLTGATFSGVVQVGTFSNAQLTLGININQAASANEILAFGSTSVSHGFINEANLATFGSFRKYDANGGTRLNGFSGASVGVDLIGNVVTEQSTRSILALGAVMLSGKKQLTNSAVTMSANQNVVCITDGTSTRFILDSDGDSHQDVGTAWTNYDHLDDVGTLDALAYNVARADDPIKTKFGEWMQERRDVLTEQKLVKFNDDGHHFVNMSKLTMLHTGAIRQMGEKLDAALQTIAALSGKLQALGVK